MTATTALKFVVAMQLAVQLCATNKLYIELTGDDQTGDGSTARPFRTLIPAYQALVADKADYEITFGPGLHFLPPGGLQLTAKLSGTNVTGAGINNTFLSGATRVTDWKESIQQDSGLRLWTATLQRNKSELLMQLFVQDGEDLKFSRRVAARSKVMHYSHSSTVDPEHAIVYEEGQVASSYYNQGDVLATIYHCWTATTHRIRSINPRNRTLTLFQAPHVDIPRCEAHSGKRFYISNARELLTITPGQFYFDRTTSELTYFPATERERAQLENGSFVAYAPSAVTLMDVRGASRVRVRDLSFVHAAADMSGFFEGDCDGQSATNLLSAAVQLNNAQHVSMERVGVRHTGGFGVWAQANVTDVLLSRLLVTDVGAGGVRVGAGVCAPVPSVHDLTLEDSVVSDGGHVYRMGPGVLVGGCTGCRVAHNDIHTWRYTGINTGCGFKNDVVLNTSVSYNHIHSIGQGELSDMGCFYHWGGRGEVHFHHNLCHGVDGYSYGGWGMYTDQTSANIVLTSNVVFNTSDAAYHNHEGNNITVSNNVLAKQRVAPYRSGSRVAADGIIRSAAPTKHWTASASFHSNILYSSVVLSSIPAADLAGVISIYNASGPIFTAGTQYTQWKLSSFDSNVYFSDCAANTGAGRGTKGGDGRGTSCPWSVRFPDASTLTKWQQRGQDQHSTVADPLFADAENHNFTLLSGSPALVRGFVPIDVNAVGPR